MCHEWVASISTAYGAHRVTGRRRQEFVQPALVFGIRLIILSHIRGEKPMAAAQKRER